jgi:hypothetical protein
MKPHHCLHLIFNNLAKTTACCELQANWWRFKTSYFWRPYYCA